MQLSKNFSYEELIASAEAVRRGLDNTPPPEIIKNLQKLAVKLEEVRTVLGQPMYVISGYRSPDLNFAIRGSKNSQHMQGLACDFICPALGTPYDVCKKLSEAKLDYDQIIHEFGQWTHIGFANDRNRKELLTICNPKLGYRRGIFTCENPPNKA